MNCLKTKTFPARRRAFTLIEVSIAMTISLMAMVAVMSIFVASSKMAVTSFMQNKAAMEARHVIDHLTSDVRMAISLEKNYKSYTADKNTLILKLPSIDAQGFAIDVTSKHDYVVYDQPTIGSNVIVRKVYADTGSSRASGEEIVGRSVKPGVYAVQPDSTGEYIVYYEFASIQKHGDQVMEVPTAGSVQLRNHQSGA